MQTYILMFIGNIHIMPIVFTCMLIYARKCILFMYIYADMYNTHNYMIYFYLNGIVHTHTYTHTVMCTIFLLTSHKNYYAGTVLPTKFSLSMADYAHCNPPII